VRTTIASMVAALVLLMAGSVASQTPQLPASIVFTGSHYYSSGPTVFFDGAVMVRVGTYDGIPIYVDPTRDPINVVYVPISGKLMRPYERSRAEQAADLVAPPAAPAPDYSVAAVPDAFDASAPDVDGSGAAIAPAEAARSVAPTRAPGREPPASRGIWIEFQDRLWTPAGRANTEPGRDSRLQVIGRYFDFPVYQQRGQRDRIYVPATPGGPLIRYDLRVP